ncbi:hypothetical protein [Streptomyces sp. AC555_RSS877]|uniref:hypothetical protein n=1 Tax=Streptomyces sp. AC555_RSS877 TaxID=2823688 RepID=UPI001C255975|nr:hypothetical protein [Streptomyces sp. AC555_RSS877]
MQPVIVRLDAKSAIDVGANAGCFPIKLASSGIPTVALESDPKTFGQQPPPCDETTWPTWR